MHSEANTAEDHTCLYNYVQYIYISISKSISPELLCPEHSGPQRYVLGARWILDTIGQSMIMKLGTIIGHDHIICPLQSFGGLLQVEVDPANEKNLVFTFKHSSISSKVG